MAGPLYRIAQETVRSAVRRGEADEGRILLATGEDQRRLPVRDDGSGFVDEGTDGTGMGTRIMNHWARIVGGTLEIDNTPGEDPTLTCPPPARELPYRGRHSRRHNARRIALPTLTIGTCPAL